MKATGVVRNLDALGRLVVPMEIRRNLGIAEGDPIEIFVDGNEVILRKYEPGCHFCGESNGLKYLFGKPVCVTCTAKIAEIYSKQQ